MAIADYLRKLVELKNQLVANLKSMGVTADESEKLNTLVPKVLECKTEQNVEFVEGTDFAGNNNTSGLLLAISKVNIPDSVTSIGDEAFENCSGLSSVTIGNGVTSIGDMAFAFCTSLAHIYYKGTEEQWNAITKDMNWNHSMGTDVSGGTVITYNYTG